MLPGRLLIVDDDADILQSLLDLVEHMPEPITAFPARNAQEALAILRDQDVDAILTDLRMPGMNGLDFLDAVHGAYPKGAILLTAYPHDIRAVGASRKGLIRRYMHKPGDIKVLEQMIRELLFPERILAE